MSALLQLQFQLQSRFCNPLEGAFPAATAIVAPDFYNGGVKSPRSDVVVIGAGVVGLAMAMRAAQSGLRVALIGHKNALPDTTITDRWDHRVFAISQASKVLLERLAVWQYLFDARIEPINTMSVFANGGDSVPVQFDAAQVDETALAWIVEQSNLFHALSTGVSESNVRWIEADVSALDFDDDTVTVSLSDDSTVQSRLVIGADGAGSSTRSMAGIAHQQTSYVQRALVAHVAVEQPHQRCAYQWFGEHGILALLPLPDSNGQHRMSMVWSCAVQNAKQMLQAGATHTAEQLSKIASPEVGRCSAISELVSFPLNRQAAHSLISHRVALVGDAAHVVHPLAGQGLNLGLSDVATLGQLLEHARATGRASRFDPGHKLLLRRYRRHRAEPLLAMQTSINGLERLFSPMRGSDSLRSLFDAIPVTTRELGWDFVARNSFVRRQLIKLAER